MSPVKDKWSVEDKPLLDDIDIHSFEEWDRDPSIDMPVYHRRRTAGLWTALASLTVVLGMLAVYGYSVISKHDAEITWLAGRTGSISALRDRADKLEASLGDWNTRQESLAARVKKMDAGLKSELNSVRVRATELVANARQKEHDDLNQSTAALSAQIAEITSLQHSEHFRMVQLEKELASTRQELASARANYARELAALQQQQVSSRREIASLNNVLSTDQVEFEAKKNHDAEIVPGISLHLTSTNIARQQYGGWIWLARNRRRIWIRRQVIETPQVFYPKPGGEAYELVVTRVSPKEVTGYLLVPSDTSSQQRDVASNSKFIAKPAQDSF